MSAWFLFIFFLTSLVSSAVVPRRKVVVVSFDGFRWDYFDKFQPPAFKFLAKTGVHAPRGITNPFVTKTFPDHYTLATGLYEENHGIVGNRMYDPELDEYFNMGSTETRWWDGGEPLWITAALQGKKSGVFFWPGSEATVKNTTATEFKPYNQSIPFDVRVKQVVQWLKHDDFDLVMMYYHEPDKTGHKYGPDSKQLEETIKLVDNNLRILLDGLKEESLLDEVDLIVLSDHGMTKVTYDREHVLALSEHGIDMGEDIERVVEDGVIFSFYPKPGREDYVYNKLKSIDFNMTVYRKEEIPDRYHYKNHRRIPPMLIIADEGYQVFQRFNTSLLNAVGGEHGYSNELITMNPIFFARGPHFKRHYSTGRFETVNIYPLVCHLLGLSPAPNNGSLATVRDMLNSGYLPSSHSSWVFIGLGFLVSILNQIF